jgi:hypothetical protein
MVRSPQELICANRRIGEDWYSKTVFERLGGRTIFDSKNRMAWLPISALLLGVFFLGETITLQSYQHRQTDGCRRLHGLSHEPIENLSTQRPLDDGAHHALGVVLGIFRIERQNSQLLGGELRVRRDIGVR